MASLITRLLKIYVAFVLTWYCQHQTHVDLISNWVPRGLTIEIRILTVQCLRHTIMHVLRYHNVKVISIHNLSYSQTDIIHGLEINIFYHIFMLRKYVCKIQDQVYQDILHKELLTMTPTPPPPPHCNMKDINNFKHSFAMLLKSMIPHLGT